MALAALIAAYHESDEPGGPLRALLPIAGRTLIERQARLAVAAGAERIVVLVERVPPELGEAIDRLRRARFPLTLARSPSEAAEAFGPLDGVLLIADGFVGEEAQLREIASASGQALLVLPDQEVDERFERIDGRSRWGGVALLRGSLVGETAAMLRDWDPQSTLLRRAVQGGARQIPLSGPAAGRLIIAERAADLEALEQAIIERALGGAGGGWITRYLLGPFERLATTLLMTGGTPPARLGTAAAVLTALGAVAFARGILWLGLLLLLAATPLDGIAARLARLRMDSPVEQSWWALLLPALSGAALVALGYTLAEPHGWGTALLAAAAILFLLAQRVELEAHPAAAGRFAAERKGMTWLMLPFALGGLWLTGLAALFAYAAGSFFWVQRRAHRPLAVRDQD